VEKPDKTDDLPPEVVEHVRQSYEDAKFRARLWEVCIRWAKAIAAFIVTTHATVIVLDKGWEGVKRWLASLVR
jgi:hypothetical protein